MQERSRGCLPCWRHSGRSRPSLPVALVPDTSILVNVSWSFHHQEESRGSKGQHCYWFIPSLISSIIIYWVLMMHQGWFCEFEDEWVTTLVFKVFKVYERRKTLKQVIKCAKGIVIMRSSFEQKQHRCGSQSNSPSFRAWQTGARCLILLNLFLHLWWEGNIP